MVYLRARFYSLTLGRFFQTDPSRLERNIYQYAVSNPINFTDPSGLLFWYFSGGRASLIGKPSQYIRHNRFAHPWIEYWVEQQNGFWNTHAEFPGGASLKMDLIVFDRVNTPGFNSSPIDFGAPVTGSVFEIEPAEPSSIVKGWAEINFKKAMISSGAMPFSHSGVLPMVDHWPIPIRTLGPYAGAPYSLSVVTWQFGDQLSPSERIGPVRIDPNSFGVAGISGIPNTYWAMLVTPGLILYVDEQTLIKAGITLSSVAVGEYFFEQYKKARNRPDGGLLPNPQPGFSQSPDENCSILDFLNSLLQYFVPLPGWLE